MTEQLISFETAKLAKDKGFKFKEDDKDFYKYSGYYKYGRIGNGKWTLESVYDIETLHWGSELSETIDAPTQSLLQKWLRDTYDIHINIICKSQFTSNSSDDEGDHQYLTSFIIEVKKNKDNYKWDIYNYLNDIFDIYEEALEIGLQEALTLI